MTYKAILTKFHPDTGHGSHYSARDPYDGKKLRIPTPHSVSMSHRHQHVAQMFADREGWKGLLVEGVISEQQHVFVFAPEPDDIAGRALESVYRICTSPDYSAMTATEKVEAVRRFVLPVLDLLGKREA